MAQAPLETVQVETSQSVPAGTVCRPNNDPYLSAKGAFSKRIIKAKGRDGLRAS